MKNKSTITAIMGVVLLLCLTSDFWRESDSGLQTVSRFVEAKKPPKRFRKAKKYQKKKENLPEIGSPKKPDDMKNEHYCFSCLAMTDFATGTLGIRDSEADILEVIDSYSICNP